MAASDRVLRFLDRAHTLAFLLTLAGIFFGLGVVAGGMLVLGVL